jgi:hypothetical protein
MALRIPGKYKNEIVLHGMATSATRVQLAQQTPVITWRTAQGLAVTRDIYE